MASDWNSLDQRTTGVGSGAVEFPPDNSGLREGAAAGSSARVDGNELHQSTAPSNKVGRQGAEGLDHLPSDATSR